MKQKPCTRMDGPLVQGFFIKERSGMSDSLFQLEKIGFQANGNQILQDISFTVNKGEVIVFSGPSGSGKSTLLKLIGTLLSPTSGKIYYRGTDLQKIDPVEYRKEVSYFFQNASLFDETVQENLSFPARIREEGFDRERAKKLLERVQIPETYLSKEVKELSGGEKQRVALVRNLMYQPKVLLLDEVTSSLDQENRAIVLDLVRDMMKDQQTTVLAVTHNQEEIDQASRLITIKGGKMEESK